jgi:hypothetical protein
MNICNTFRDFITDSASSQFKIRHSKDSKNHLIHSSENRTGGDHLNLLGKVFFPHPHKSGNIAKIKCKFHNLLSW